MKTIALTVALMAVGCGGPTPHDGSREPDALASTEWSTTNGRYCASGLLFGNVGNFRKVTMCNLPDATIGVEEQRGVYAVSGDRLDLTIVMSSCPGQGADDGGLFSIAGGHMRVELADSALTYAKVPIGSGTQTPSPFAYGCFRELGEARDFTPNQLARL